ncbi:MAG: bifunctional oligoribonuclease/PAP phosphatase NrnA [bacterium]
MIKPPKDLISLLKRSKNILIVSHVDPDCDSTGSALAMSQILKKMKLRSTLFCHSKIPPLYSFLPGIRSYTDKLLKKKYDLTIALDCGDYRRMDIPAIDRPRLGVLVNIDHHSDNTQFGDINYTHSVAATAELVYYLANILKVKLDANIATCLYSAVMTDTGSFRYDNVTPKIFDVARQLVLLGADPNKIAQQVYESRTINSLKLLGLALDNIKMFSHGKVVMTGITRKMFETTRAGEDDINGIVDHLRSIKGVEVAVLLREVNSKRVKVNFRSKRYVNVQKVAKSLGGGGHIRASGVILAMDRKSALKKIIQAISKIF